MLHLSATSHIIVNQVIILFLLMAVGGLARRKGLLNDTLSGGLSVILINISLPALIFKSFIFDFSWQLLQNGLLVLALSVLVHIILLVVARIAFVRYGDAKKSVMTVAGAFPNAGFMGLPLVDAVFGQLGVFYASIFMIPYNLILWTYGQDLFCQERTGAPLLSRILAFSTTPPVLATGAGLLLFLLSFKPPAPATAALTMLGGMTLPLSMLIVGDRIAQIRPVDLVTDRDVYYNSLVRLLLAPVATFAVLRFFTDDPIIAGACVTIEAMPPAVVAVLFAQMYNGDTTFASKCVVIQHALSLVTIPIMLILLT